MKIFKKIVLLAFTISMFFLIACDSEKSTKSKVENLADVLFINEFLARNDAANTDENGEYDDWVEIYNSGSEDIDLGGFFISDDITQPLSYQIPKNNPEATTIKAGGFLVLWCDKQPEQGATHVDIKLSVEGEYIILTADDATTVVDSYSYGAAIADQSTGRIVDGGNEWGNFETPTPGASNE